MSSLDTKLTAKGLETQLKINRQFLKRIEVLEKDLKTIQEQLIKIEVRELKTEVI